MGTMTQAAAVSRCQLLPETDFRRGPERTSYCMHRLISEAKIRVGETQKSDRTTAAFVLSLLAGIFMVSAGGVMGGMSAGMMGTGYMRGPHAVGHWMWPMGSIYHFGAGAPWFWLALIAGAVVLAGAVLLQAAPRQRRFWGAVILAASALELIAGPAGLVAGTLGVIGGALALGG